MRDTATIEFLRSVGVEIPDTSEVIIKYLFDNLDIVQKFPPAVLWGFDCGGRARPSHPAPGCREAMIELKYNGRILELHAYTYIIWLLMRQPPIPALDPIIIFVKPEGGI